VVHTDYHYALVYVCRRSSDDDEFCSYETMLVLGRPTAMIFNSKELEEYFKLTLGPQCIPAATQLDFITDTGNYYYYNTSTTTGCSRTKLPKV